MPDSNIALRLHNGHTRRVAAIYMAEDPFPANGFFQPNKIQADFAYWAKMPIWTGRIAAAVFLGYNPNAFNSSLDVSIPIPKSGREAFNGLRALAEAASSSHQVSRPESPLHWMEWNKSLGLPLLPELEAEILKWDGKSGSARRDPVASAEPSDSQDAAPPIAVDVGPRERDSMLKIIIGMARAKYKFDPNAQRSSVPKTIESDLERYGVGVNDDTIRKYLREGAELLPPPLE